jgi:DNA primase
LHALPGTHGALIAWLERDLAEHGPRPWAVVRAALRDDGELAPALDAMVEPLGADTDFAALRGALNTLLVKDLDQRLEALVPQVAADPAAQSLFKQLSERRRQLKSL